MTKIFNEKVILNCEDNSNSYTFYYSYNENTSFQDLLEFVAFLLPELDICQCNTFKIINPKNKNDKNNKFSDIINESKIFKNKMLLNNLYYKGNIQCSCKSIYKNCFKNSKKVIIDYLNELEQSKIKDSEEKKDVTENETDSKDNIIIALKNEKQKLSEHINSLEKKLETENQNEIEKLKKEKKILEVAINGDIQKINELKNYGIVSDILQPKKNNIKVDPKSNQIIGNETFNKEKFIDFYDVIIDVKSIKDINKGWAIKMSQKAKEKYENFRSQKIIKIGVIGNSNKGKSFLLSKISKIDLPSGTSIRTEGLSIKYPDLEGFVDRKIALLDSAGLETPVLKVEEENNIEVKKSVKELFKEKSREKLITELFLQNYIINNSDILLVVVGILTYSEQKLLNRIKTEIQRAKINKPLFIIHNLITYTSVEQVKEYISQYLLESATFNLEEGHKISTKTQQKLGIYYYEKNNDPKIYHLIFANEGSDAGKFYNQFTLDFLENNYQNVTDLETFDVIETIKGRFKELSKEIIEKPEKKTKEQKEQKEQKVIREQAEKTEQIEQTENKNDEIIFDTSNSELIKLIYPKEIILKKCLIDELGFSNLKANGFEPTYNYYKKDNKIIVRVEIPGNCNLNSEIDYSGEYTIIKVFGEKKKDREPAKLEDNFFNSREMGFFSLDIPLKTDDFLLSNDDPEIIEKKGVFILQYKLDEKKKAKAYNKDEEDDI